MNRTKTVRILATFIVATGFGIVLLRLLDAWRFYSPVFYVDLPKETVREAMLSGIVESLFGAANVVFGFAIWRRCRWGWTALIAWTVLWAGLFAGGTLATSAFFDLRLAGYPYLVCLAGCYISTGYLAWSGRKPALET